MRVITATEPVTLTCPRCFRRLVLHHAKPPSVVDLAAAMAGMVLDVGEPTGVQVALALHVRDCSGGHDFPSDEDPSDSDPRECPI